MIGIQWVFNIPLNWLKMKNELGAAHCPNSSSNEFANNFGFIQISIITMIHFHFHFDNKKQTFLQLNCLISDKVCSDYLNLMEMNKFRKKFIIVQELHEWNY